MPSRDLSGNAFIGNSLGERTSLFRIPRYAPPEIRSLRTIPSVDSQGPVYGPPVPEPNSAVTQTPPPSNPVPSASDAIRNIIKTGSVAPKATPVAPQSASSSTPPSLSDVQKRELDIAQTRVNQGNGTETDRKNIEYAKANGLWSPAADAQTGKESVPIIGSPNDSNFLRSRADNTRNELFNSVYGYTPDDWQNLDPATQRRLRNQRVQGLAGELGNLNAAISAAQADEDKNRSTALDTLNTYLKFGVLDELDQTELASLSARSGLNPRALSAMSQQEDPPELRSIDGDLYAIQWNPDDKKFETTLVKKGAAASAGRSGGGSGSSATSTAFNKEAAGFRELIIGNEIDWPTAWNTLKIRYPEKTNQELDQALGGSAGYDEATGTFTGKNTGLAARQSQFEKGSIQILPDGSTIVH